MNFGLNRLQTAQNHQLEPRNRLDFIMMEPVEEAGNSAAVEFDGGGGGGEIEREHMFDKVVTPSDVGKLNRLVIPKQHAERFFPLDSSTNDKGLLLNFEDRNGKSWRFRYSYWNSSQSYVMTKGWSRFVKEKRLDAGDIVSFQRGVGEIGRDRLYIDWRRRPELPINHPHHHHHHPGSIRPSIVIPTTGATAWGSLVWRPLSATVAAGYHHPAATTAPRDHTHLSRININNNYNNNSNINVMYDWSRGCCPYGSYENVRVEEGIRRVAPRLGDYHEDEEELEREGNSNQVIQEYCSGGNSMGVVQGNYEDHHSKTTTTTNSEEGDTPVKKSRLRLFGVNMEMNAPISSSSDEFCDLLLSSSSNSNPKTTTQFQLSSPPSDDHHQT